MEDAVKLVSFYFFRHPTTSSHCELKKLLDSFVNSQILVLQPEHTKEINHNLVPTTSTQVFVNDVKIEIALWGC